MKTTRHILICILLAAMGIIAAGCSAHIAEDPVEDAVTPDTPQPGKTVLSMHIRLGDISYDPESRAYEEELPANANEKIQSLRIIILDSSGHAEHNSYWETTADNAVVERTADFPVKANDTKTVILVANEKSLPDDTRNFFADINASAGEWVEMNQVRALTMTGISDIDGTKPLVMTDIHTITIGSQPKMERLPITRAAVKLTYRITNHSQKNNQSVYQIGFNRGANEQYLFRGDILATTKQIYSRKFTINQTIGPNETIEIVKYIPEGPNDYTYQATMQKTYSNRNPTVYTQDLPGLKGYGLPRNTHVVINIGLNKDSKPTISYQICPWNKVTVDIPEFN